MSALVALSAPTAGFTQGASSVGFLNEARGIAGMAKSDVHGALANAATQGVIACSISCSVKSRVSCRSGAGERGSEWMQTGRDFFTSGAHQHGASCAEFWQFPGIPAVARRNLNRYKAIRSGTPHLAHLDRREAVCGWHL